MYLIDTSVWIDSLRQVDNPAVRVFRELILNGKPFGVTGVIFQEVLQGARDRTGFERLRTELGSLTFHHPRDPIGTYAAAADLYRRCREQGVTIRSTLDCLIATIAIEHDLVLIHNDRDFDHIASICPQLKCGLAATRH